MDDPGLTLSVVVPMFNEQAVVPLLAVRLRPALDGIGVPYEVVAVDDGSRDSTYAVLLGLRRSWPELRIVRLRRNSGHQAALNAGLMASRGAYVASIDADLQDPPEKIPEMLRLARADGLDIVYGVRGDRGTDTSFKRWTAAAYYGLMRRLVGRDVPSQAGDFRLLSRSTVEVLRELPEHAPVLRLLVPWTGFSSGQVSYVREERAAGSTKYPLRKMVLLAVDSVTSFSAAPLRLATWFGASGMLLCAVLVTMGIVAYLRGSVVPGWSSLFLAILFLGTIQLLCLGLLGEYIGRLYTAVQNRPAYFIASDTGQPLPADRAGDPEFASSTARGDH